MHQHSHIQPHLHTDCAIKVEVKLHFSEQQYWADLRTEAVTILEKVMFSLPSPTNPTTTTATAATIATTTGSSTVESLTEREGRRLEKWLDAIEAVATGGKHTSSAPTTTAATATATTDTSSGAGRVATVRRYSRLVFIGLGLDKEALQEGLLACRAQSTS